MVFKMAHGSLFAVLLRSPWWYSVLIAMAIIAISVLIAGGQYVVLGIFTSLPFLGIAAFALYKQALLPSDERVLEVVEQARSMPALKIAHKIAQSYTPHRYDSAAFSGDVAELEITRGNKKLLLSTKRFKAGNTGIEQPQAICTLRWATCRTLPCPLPSRTTLKSFKLGALPPTSMARCK